MAKSLVKVSDINPWSATDKQVIAFDQASNKFTIQDQTGGGSVVSYWSLVSQVTSSFIIALTDAGKFITTWQSTTSGNIYYTWYHIFLNWTTIEAKTYNQVTNVYTTVTSISAGAWTIYWMVVTPTWLIAILTAYTIKTYSFNGTTLTLLWTTPSYPYSNPYLKNLSCWVIDWTHFLLCNWVDGDWYVMEFNAWTNLWSSVSSIHDVWLFVSVAGRADLCMPNAWTIAIVRLNGTTPSTEVYKLTWVNLVLAATYNDHGITGDDRIWYQPLLVSNTWIWYNQVNDKVYKYTFNWVATITQTLLDTVSGLSTLANINDICFNINSGSLYLLWKYTITDNNNTGVLWDLQVATAWYKIWVNQSWNKLCYMQTKASQDSITVCWFIAAATLTATIYHYLVNWEIFEVIWDNLFLR